MTATKKPRKPKKRKYRTVSEDELLTAILAGRFAADSEGNVYSVNGHRHLLATFLDPQRRPCVKLYLDGGRRTTTVGRAVWMICNRRLVPEGFAVDHIDRDKENNRPENLRLLEFSENSRQNQYWDDEFEDDF